MTRVAVVRFPGSNCDFDTFRAAERGGADAYFVWHRDVDLHGADVVILPGGFSYGDYLRSGAIARFSPVMQAVKRHAAEGGPVLGICNGFQILCEAHLLPGALMRNAGLAFVSKPVDVTVERTDTVFTGDYELGARLRLPVAHGEGRFVASPDTLRMLEAEGRVVLRYVAATERSPFQPNPNGSTNHIAGISNAEGNVVGIMPHPERAADRVLGLTGGTGIFTSLVRWHQEQSKTGSIEPMKQDKPSRNEDEYFAREDAELLRRQRQRANAASVDAERKTHYMKCPKDGYDLVSSEYHGVQIETCPHCGGMWLDAGELQAVAHEDHPSVLGRVLTDALSAFRRSPRNPRSSKPTRGTGSPSS